MKLLQIKSAFLRPLRRGKNSRNAGGPNINKSRELVGDAPG
jgi:hypothetical protein